ncbi:MAG: hypothetical protein IT435_07000 [Phycisphaerales bacterium]|nr:hypothetical protein [Phycisphaerales bacterium]
MNRTPTHPLIACICLVAFVLGQGVIGLIGVRCEDVSGRVRIELACDKTADGSCLTEYSLDSADSTMHGDETDCIDTDRGHTPHPCKDTPIEDLAGMAGAPAKTGAGGFGKLLAPAVSAMHHAPVVDPALCRARQADRRGVGPPDSVARLRTVILMV